MTKRKKLFKVSKLTKEDVIRGYDDWDRVPYVLRKWVNQPTLAQRVSRLPHRAVGVLGRLRDRLGRLRLGWPRAVSCSKPVLVLRKQRDFVRDTRRWIGSDAA